MVDKQVSFQVSMSILCHFIFQRETDVELGSLLRAEGQSVYNQLLLYLSVSYNKVFSGLAMLASKDDTYTGPKDLKTTQHLVSRLPSVWLGYCYMVSPLLYGPLQLSTPVYSLSAVLWNIIPVHFITFFTYTAFFSPKQYFRDTRHQHHYTTNPRTKPFASPPHPSPSMLLGKFRPWKWGVSYLFHAYISLWIAPIVKFYCFL